MECDEQTIRDIFYTGSHAFRADNQLIVDICFLLQENLLFVEKHAIAAAGLYQKYLDDIRCGKIPVSDIDGGQIEHMALKLIGRDYLANETSNDIVFEREF